MKLMINLLIFFLFGIIDKRKVELKYNTVANNKAFVWAASPNMNAVLTDCPLLAGTGPFCRLPMGIGLIVVCP